MAEAEIKKNGGHFLKFDRKKMFSYKWIVTNLPFFLFLAGLAVFYIYNGHMADKLVRNISASEKNIKELEYEYKSAKAEVIYRSKATELIKAVEPLGLRESKQPPVVLEEERNN